MHAGTQTHVPNVEKSYANIQRLIEECYHIHFAMAHIYQHQFKMYGLMHLHSSEKRLLCEMRLLLAETHHMPFEKERIDILSKLQDILREKSKVTSDLMTCMNVLL